jgi:mannose-1-phosphate guanylyltransferase
MKAILLVAGIGTRLRPITYTTPKCLLPFGGKPLLEIWLDRLENAGVAEVLINTHWLPEKVNDFVDDFRGRTHLSINVFHENELLGSAGTIAANRDWFDEDSFFFIVYGDNLTWLNLPEMIRFHESHGFPVTLGVFHTEYPERCGIIEADDSDTVSGFWEKPEKPKSNLAAAGIYLADNRIFEVFPAEIDLRNQVLDLGLHIFPKLVRKMKYFIIDELIDIGTSETYAIAQQQWANREEANE